MDDKYSIFFREVSNFIIDLGIEKKADVEGCTPDDIVQIENQFGKLPLAYKSYLETFGRNFLFSFFDGEQFSYKDYEDINEFVQETLERDGNFKIVRPFIAISHYRYEYFSFIYLDGVENDNPKVWSYEPYPEEGSENPKIAEDKFTDTILLFFKKSLENRAATFHWVTADEVNQNIIQERYVDWAGKIIRTVDYINTFPTENQFLRRVHGIIFSYFEQQKDTLIKLAQGKIAAEKDDDLSPVKRNKNIWNRILKWFK
jgi:hypothetical protein